MNEPLKAILMKSKYPLSLYVAVVKHPYRTTLCLDTAECRRLLQLHRGQNTFLFAHCFKRHLLTRLYPECREWEWVFYSEPHGKPFVKQPLSFNLSHSHGAVAMVICSGANRLNIGIDLERYRSDDFRKLSTSVLHPQEQQWLNLDGQDNEKRVNKQFYQLWTAKESLLKAVGCGLGHSLNTINCVDSLKFQRYQLHWQKDDYQLQKIDFDWGVVSVCWPSCLPFRVLTSKQTSDQLPYTEFQAMLL